MSDASAPSSHRFMWPLLSTLIPTLILAFGSYVYTTLDARRKERLEFVRGQIGTLYGPLYTLTATSEFVWHNLGKKHMPNFNDEQNLPDIVSITWWRRLLTDVVIPLNDRAEDVLLSSRETIRCPELREELQEFFTFTQSVKLVVKNWKPEDDLNDESKRSKDVNVPEINYPNNLSRTLSAELNDLHRREKVLEDGFFGLFYSTARPDCASPEKPS
jgi:hypothetical protein